MTTLSWTALRRLLAARRRVVAAVLAGLAVLCGLSAVRPAGPPTVLVLAAARDLAPGAPLGLADLRAVALPASVVPAGALRPGAEVLGRLVAGAVRQGEPLTDVRLVGPGLFAALAPGSVAVPVRFADAGGTALLRAGDRIDVLAAPAMSLGLDPALAGPAPPPVLGDAAGAAGARPPPPLEARVVAADVVVLAVPGAGDPAAAPSGYADGSLVVLGCSPAVARALAAAAAGGRLSPALRAPAAAGRPP